MPYSEKEKHEHDKFLFAFLINYAINKDILSSKDMVSILEIVDEAEKRKDCSDNIIDVFEKGKEIKFELQGSDSDA